MKKQLVVLATAIALVGSTMAFAAPRTLSDAGLDSVSAGANSGAVVAESFINNLFTLGGDTSTSSLLRSNRENVSASGTDSIAVEGNNSQQAVVGALATDNGTAVSGAYNLTLAQTGNIAAGFAAAGDCNQVVDQSCAEIAQVGSDHATLDAVNVEDNTVKYGSVLVVGDCNTTELTTDNSLICGEIEGQSTGVIAGKAHVDNAFNENLSYINVFVKINDSFNNKTKEQSICGQDHLSAIVNATTLGDANVGSNLNVTTATASTETEQSSDDSFSASVPVISGNAIAATLQNQAVFNNFLAFGNSEITF